MAVPMKAAALAATLLAEGVHLQEVGDWTRHSRNRVGPWGPVHGVMIHHTVTSGTQRTVDLVRTGYKGLPGPLCHGMIAKDGTVHLVSAGRANHAGPGDPDVLRAVIAETARPRDDEATTDGNRHFYGFECENLGDGEDPWPEVQLDAITRAAAAICRHHGWGPESVIGHLEWQPGKPDPVGFSMDWMRERIAVRLGRQEPPVQLPPPRRLTVSLSRVITAARKDPGLPGAPVTYEGVRTVEAALVDEGLLSARRLDGHYGSDTRAAMTAWQEFCGYRGRKPGQPADGVPGRDSLTRLGARHGFDVID
ncbi:N-acetylmuramoyl-L-alanine amidase [Streptomyces chilikensis]|uniref:N-acetylmuramoyl-L-alanine amidase n=1 Tax=Streptomyces chilikensis TaxID=1194079 RepID=A0ABV3EJF4_9ACTN